MNQDKLNYTIMLWQYPSIYRLRVALLEDTSFCSKNPKSLNNNLKCSQIKHCSTQYALVRYCVGVDSRLTCYWYSQCLSIMIMHNMNVTFTSQVCRTIANCFNHIMRCIRCSAKLYLNNCSYDQNTIIDMLCISLLYLSNLKFKLIKLHR